MADKKSKTLAEILKEGPQAVIKHYQSLEGEDFETRVDAFAKFFTHNGGDIPLSFANHAHDVAQEAYISAANVLKEKAPGPSDKLGTEDDVASVIESYVDTFIEKALNGSKFKEAIEYAKAKGASPEEIRKLKGEFFSNYHRTEQGALNPLDANQLKKWRGKSRAKLEAHLRQLQGNTVQLYAQHMESEAYGKIFNVYDRASLAKHLEPIFEKAGLIHDEHEKTLVTRSVDQMVQDLATYHTKGDMSKRGYKARPAEEAKPGG
ncbi:hypothetical protein HYV82_06305 [Candidatus Woesearchaeota archaeon]|nr:hypothetical protein [Candidatus Woesearchaeota archaeon]